MCTAPVVSGIALRALAGAAASASRTTAKASPRIGARLEIIENPPRVQIMGTGIPEPEIQVRLESVRVGQILTFIVCAGAQIYALATWDRPHRALLTVIFGVAVASACLISLLPVEKIVRGPNRERWFLAWSALDFALVAAIAAVDGGPRSPFVMLFVLPTIFAALSYPLWSTFATGLIAVAGFTLVAATSSHASLE